MACFFTKMWYLFGTEVLTVEITWASRVLLRWQFQLNHLRSQSHRAPHSERPHTRGLTLCDCWLKIFNDSIFWICCVSKAWWDLRACTKGLEPCFIWDPISPHPSASPGWLWASCASVPALWSVSPRGGLGAGAGRLGAPGACEGLHESHKHPCTKGARHETANKIHRDRLRDNGRKEKGFFLLYEQGDLHFHFVLNPANYIAGPGFIWWCPNLRSVRVLSHYQGVPTSIAFGGGGRSEPYRYIFLGPTSPPHHQTCAQRCVCKNIHSPGITHSMKPAGCPTTREDECVTQIQGSDALLQPYRRRELVDMRKTHDVCKRDKKAVPKRPTGHGCVENKHAWGKYWADLHFNTDSCSPQVGDCLPFWTCLCFPSALHGACLPFIIVQGHHSAESKVKPAECGANCPGSKPSSALYELCDLGQVI